MEIEVFLTDKDPSTLGVAEDVEQKKHFAKVCHRVRAQSVCSLGEQQRNNLDYLVGTMTLNFHTGE